MKRYLTRKMSCPSPRRRPNCCSSLALQSTRSIPSFWPGRRPATFFVMENIKEIETMTFRDFEEINTLGRNCTFCCYLLLTRKMNELEGKGCRFLFLFCLCEYRKGFVVQQRRTCIVWIIQYFLL